MYEGLEGKRVLVTGGSGGIGSAMVRAFSRRDARVGIHYWGHPGPARRLCREVEQAGRQAAVFQADLRRPDSAPALLRAFIREFGGIDVLINNAGAVIGPRHALKLRAADWEQTMALNATTPFFLAQQAMLAMRAQGTGGKIINISSISAAYGGSPVSLHYAAAKAALEAATVGLARLGAPDVLVNAIRAGFIATAFHRRMGRRALAGRITRIPLRRAGQPDDIAQAALYVASCAGDFITGATLTVSGGD